jgi:hypothetical protein
MIKLDLHIHTKYSGDCKLEPKEILTKAKKLNFDVIGITDHNTTEGAIKTKEISEDILVLIGQEIKTDKGEIIVFGTEENLEGTFYDVVDIAKERDFFVILPHPFDNFRCSTGRFLSKENLKEISRKIDAIEVFNSRCYLNKFNKEAQNFSRNYNLPEIAGSDAHLISEFGNVKNFINCSKDEEEIFKAIKKGKLVWTGKSTGKLNFIKKKLI